MCRCPGGWRMADTTAHTWFLPALAGPFLYAACNHIDKHLLQRHFRQDGVAVLILYSALLSALVLPLVWWMSPDVLAVDARNVLILAGVAVLDVILLWAYLNAMNTDEPTVVIVFYQLVPVLGLLFGYVLLGETITRLQSVAMGVVIVGASLVSFETDGQRKGRLKARTTGFMLLACTCWAMETTVFKKVALEENLWRSFFWEHLILASAGAALFVLAPRYRARFLAGFREHSAAVLGLNVLNEGLYITGNLAVAYAALLAPVALILLMNAFQPFFVLLIGLLLAWRFPQLATERTEARHLWRKAAAIGITGVGTYVLLAH